MREIRDAELRHECRLSAKRDAIVGRTQLYNSLSQAEDLIGRFCTTYLIILEVTAFTVQLMIKRKLVYMWFRRRQQCADDYPARGSKSHNVRGNRMRQIVLQVSTAPHVLP
jgi:hypothetical protein